MGGHAPLARTAAARGAWRPLNRKAAFGIATGATSLDEREALKRAFNADPTTEPLRILICTDAAREGINLQNRCYDLIHVDLPWYSARIEQQRPDRPKLQPALKVFCRYFRYSQPRPATSFWKLSSASPN